MDAPEIDGKVYLTDEFDVQPGDQVWVQIIHADEHDVWGVRVEDDEDELVEDASTDAI